MMQKNKSKAQAKKVYKGECGAALKSFLGYLEGTEKSLSTHASYRLDIEDFFKYLEQSGRPISKEKLNQITVKKIDSYHDALKNEGQKSNTRRRKLMTLRKWFQYLKKRNKINNDIGKILPVPVKNERVPFVVDLKTILDNVQQMSEESDFYIRNKVLFLVLLNTGCLVSECASLKKSQIQSLKNPIHEKHVYSLSILNKNERTLTFLLSSQENELFEKHMGGLSEEDALFCSYNRHGKLFSTSISPRGVEMLVKAKGKEWGLKLTPRTIRHSVVVEWFKEGLKREEIQKRLGLSTNYSLQIYEPHFKKIENKS